MDPRTRATTQPAHQEHPTLPRPVSAPTADNSSRSKRLLITLLIILSTLGIGYIVIHATNAVTGDLSVNHKEYQALFLTNGQVYFGHLSKTNSTYVKLTNIYYLQVQQTVQPASSTQTAQQSVSLAKLGSELHGPEDVMYVTRDQVLFWENLKPSGQVTKAIVKYQAANPTAK